MSDVSDFDSSDDERDLNPQVKAKKQLKRTFDDAHSDSESEQEESDQEESNKEEGSEEGKEGENEDDEEMDLMDEIMGMPSESASASSFESAGSKDKSKTKVKKLTPEQLAKEQAKIKKSGVVYLSSIPPYMKPQKLRHIMQRFGEIGRIYLKPEDAQVYKSRLKQGGNKKRKFDEGWVEFAKKSEAKLAAQTMNGDIIGGKKGGFYHDDVLNVKYLKGFKWFDLTNALNREIEVREAKKQTKLSEANKINRQYVKNVEQSKTIDRIEKQKGENAAKKDFKRTFNQNKVATLRASAEEGQKAQTKGKINGVLDKIF